MAGSSISSTVTAAVTLGYGVYLSPLSITTKGEIDDGAGYGILISDVANGTVGNSGTVIGATDGIYLLQSSGTILNQGFVGGNFAAISLSNYTSGKAFVVNGGTLIGEDGIAGVEANIANSGFIYGSRTGIDLQLSTIANSGTITGKYGVYSRDGTLTNHGSIAGRTTGLYVSGGTAVNYGSISGSLSTGARLEDELGSGGVTISGSLRNAGSISGGVYGVYDGTGTFTNDGALSGRIGLAVGVSGSAGNTGTIFGSAYGVELIGRADMVGGASLSNAGSIKGGEIGVTVGVRGNLRNAGYIYGQNYGVAVYNGYLTNSGRIVNADIGVTLAGGVVDNTATIAGLADGLAMAGGQAVNYGTLRGGTNGAFLSGGSLANFGSISGNAYGVADSGATVTNYGVISSTNYGVNVARGTLTNAGTIAGSVAAVDGSFITLLVEPGAVFIGGVVNLNGKSLLGLAGSGLGTLGGIGSQITGFKEISFAAGPQWSIEGNEAGLTEGETITGFARGDTIVLDGFSAASEMYIKNTGLELITGTNSVTLDITGNFTTGSFKVTPSANQTSIVDVTCFAAGTRIATPGGETAVEALRIGDRVTTLYGGARPVKWIGRRSYEGPFLRGNGAALPVCIKAGAIADGVPVRDLWVSPGHAISIDDMLVHAGRLVNGVSIVQAQDIAEVTYFHLELETHEILLAENCPAESFMDEHFRRQFQNAGEFSALYPGQQAPALLCQPRLDSGFQLHAIQRRLRARAGIAEPRATGRLRGFVDSTGPGVCFGWAQDEAAPQAPVSLDILSGGQRIARVLANLYRDDVAAAGYGDGYQGFECPLGAGIAGAIEVRRSQDGQILPHAGLAQPNRTRAA